MSKTVENKVAVAEQVETQYELEGQVSVVKMDLDVLNHPTDSMLCTVSFESQKDKIKVYNAITDPSKKMDEMVNLPFNLKDVIAHPVELIDEETGEVNHMLRTILIDDKGNSYAGVSAGVVSALQRIFSLFGKPQTWAEPLKVKLVKRDTRNGHKVTTLICEE